MNNYEFLLRTLVATVLGSLIGFERTTKHRPAGLRTYALVCLGAMSAMALSEFLFVTYKETYGTGGDPARLGAQVISGIGFLGAGTIIHHGVSVKGLTTAASLWAVACVGLCIGSGFYFGGIVLAGVIYFILLVMNRASLYLEQKGNIDLLVTSSAGAETVGLITLQMARIGIKIIALQLVLPELEDGDPEAEPLQVKLTVKPTPGMSYQGVCRLIEKVSGVTKVEED